jgi:hypothetical protein
MSKRSVAINRRVIKFPKIFRAAKTIDFLNTCEFIFLNKNKLLPNVIIDFSPTEEISVLNVLVFVKMIEYATNNACIIGARYVASNVVSQAFRKFGFMAMVKTHLHNIDNDDLAYSTFRVKQEDGFLIAPQGLLRSATLSKQALEQNFLPSIQGYYKENPKAMFLILTCLSEVALNFWEHATEDARSVLVAYGNKSVIEIACADTGQGIISTLGPVLASKNKDSSYVLSRAMGRGITSKKNTDHMGYGLWLISEIAIATKARLYIYSEGAYYHIENGKVSYGHCAYWQGAIFYLSLPLSTGLSLVDIVDQNESEDDNEPTINWQ